MNNSSLKPTLNLTLNESARVEVVTVGRENIPVMVIDDFVADPQSLIDFACGGSPFTESPAEHYPGIRKKLPHGDDQGYGEQICRHYLSRFKTVYGLGEQTPLSPLRSVLSLSTTAVEKLRPIQMLPHFDTLAAKQFAVVHYLFGNTEYGGTSFYRHRQSGFESINRLRINEYGPLLKQQAMQARLHQNPGYINGDNDLFERTHSFAARFNRALIYPGNALHSGNLNPRTGLSADPAKGRLTANSFIAV